MRRPVAVPEDRHQVVEEPRVLDLRDHVCLAPDPKDVVVLDLRRGGHDAETPDWINLFVDFLITKRGLARAFQSDSAAFETLHAYFLDRLVPVCAQLLEAAAAAGEIVPDVEAYELMRGVGNICIGADTDPDYDARRMVQLVIAGLRRQ